MSTPRFLNRAKHWLQKRSASRAIILMYHRVAKLDSDPWSLAVTPEHFSEHLGVLQKHSQLISLSELKQAHQTGSVPDRGVVITFDDGYADNLYHAKPLLDQCGVPATIFIVSGQIGQNREFWWDELAQILLQPGELPPVLQLCLNNTLHKWHLGEAVQYSEIQFQLDRKRRAWEGLSGSRLALYYNIWQRLKPLPETTRSVVLDEIAKWAGVETVACLTHQSLTAEELYQLDRAVNIELGAHTVTHPSLAMQKTDAQRTEIQQSKANLEQMFGHAVNSFSYPYGDYTSETVKLAQEAGFTCACTTLTGNVWQKTDPFLLPRFEVQDWPGPVFERQLKQWFGVV